MTDLLVTGTFAPKLVPHFTCAASAIPHPNKDPKKGQCENPVFHSNRYPDMEEEGQ